jgi:signal transduction histidine kinase
VDLALLALLAERASLSGLPDTPNLPASPEALVPRIGEYLIDQGLLRPDQLQQALELQKQHADRGKPRLLGQTLVEMRLLDSETLDRAITRQIIELHAALQESNRTLERRVAERTAELRRALERLAEINQIKANLISNVSHELRTPLAQIKGYAELISMDQLGPLNEEQQHAVAVVLRATERLGRLIEDLIEFSTASREGLRLKLQPVDLQPLVEGAIRRSGDKADKAGVELRSEVPKGLPHVQADAERLTWVLLQLIDNGVKFTPAGGTVLLRLEPNARSVLVSVSDTGIGIPEERMEEIFEPFHQLDGSPTRRYGGTGLGLSLVRLILEGHGATMQVESHEGTGSSFSFPLPIASPGS